MLRLWRWDCTNQVLVCFEEVHVIIIICLLLVSINFHYNAASKIFTINNFLTVRPCRKFSFLRPHLVVRLFRRMKRTRAPRANGRNGDTNPNVAT